MNRIYIMFANDEALHSAMSQSMLTAQEQVSVMSFVRKCIFDGNMRSTLVLPQAPKRKKIPQPFRAMAREIFEYWPKDDRITEIKNSTGTDATEGIRNFGMDLPIYEGKLHNFA